MPDNVTANAASGGSIFATASGSWSGDTANFPGCFLAIVSGAEGSWTFAQVVGGAGAVAAGVQRMTLASDDPAVATLGGVGDAAATQGSTGSISAKLRTATGQLNTGNTSLASIDGKITACNTGAVVLAAGTAAFGKLAANSGVDIGDVDVTSVPTDPFGANADAGSATGSISAKLRFIAATGIPITGTVTVGAHAVTNAGTFVVQVDGTALTRLTDIETNTDSLAVVGNGNAATALRVSIANDSTGIVSLTTSTASIGKLASNTGVTIGAVEIAAAQTLATVTTVGTVTTCSTVTTVSTLTGSGVAHDAVDSSAPHKIGAKATASVLGATPVAAADRTDLYAGTDGVLLNRPHTSLEDIISETKTNTDGASTAMTSGFAATASQRIYLTTLIIANSSASNITVDIRDGSAGSVLITVPVPATGGAIINFPVPLRFTANTAAAFDGSAAATTLSVSMVGFKSKA